MASNKHVMNIATEQICTTLRIMLVYEYTYIQLGLPTKETTSSQDNVQSVWFQEFTNKCLSTQIANTYRISGFNGMFLIIVNCEKY